MVWNMKAPEEKWQQYANKLEARNTKATKIITDETLPMNTRAPRQTMVLSYEL